MRQMIINSKPNNVFFTFKKSSIAAFFTSLFIAFIIILPSGSVFGVNVKVMSMILMIIFISYSIFSSGKISKKSLSCFFVTLFAMVFIFLFYIVGVFGNNNYEYVTKETFLFVSFFIPSFFIYLAIIEGIITREQFLKVIIYSSLVYTVVKLFIVFLFAVSSLPILAFVVYMRDSHGVYPMMMKITDNITRLQLANDFIMCFLLYAMLAKSDLFSFLKKKMFFFCVTVLSIGVFISFSRYMFLIVFLACLLRLILIRKITYKGFFSVFLLLSFSMFFVFSNFDKISEAIQTRFSSEASASSDMARDLQVNCLSEATLNSPIMGNGGFGAYSSQCPGPEGDEYSYEVQYLGFTYKFGFLGTLFLIVLYSCQMIFSYSGNIFSRNNLITLIGLVAWLCIGMFNPYLISAYASVIMAMLLCCLEKNENALT